MSYPPGSTVPALRARRWLLEAVSAVAGVLFPAWCVGCGAFGTWLCSRCLAGLDTIRPPVCPGCGLPLPPDDPGDRCHLCRITPYKLDGVRSFGQHTGLLRRAIHRLKYEGLAVLAAPLGQAMGEAWPSLAPDYDPSVVVPVPLHKARQRQRGYNQAVLLARELARALGRPVAEGCLFRIRHTRPQVGLNGSERHANVADAFYCAPGTLAGQRVLLVDDVFTTGATLESAGRAVRQGGALSVWAYTLARAV